VGDWTIHSENAVLNEPDGGIVYKFHARDLHLVLGPAGSPFDWPSSLSGVCIPSCRELFHGRRSRTSPCRLIFTPSGHGRHWP
jgi:hypothetical protein